VVSDPAPCRHGPRAPGAGRRTQLDADAEVVAGARRRLVVHRDPLDLVQRHDAGPPEAEGNVPHFEPPRRRTDASDTTGSVYRCVADQESGGSEHERKDARPLHGSAKSRPAPPSRSLRLRLARSGRIRLLAAVGSLRGEDRDQLSGALETDTLGSRDVLDTPCALPTAAGTGPIHPDDERIPFHLGSRSVCESARPYSARVIGV